MGSPGVVLSYEVDATRIKDAGGEKAQGWFMLGEKKNWDISILRGTDFNSIS
jgi:hypothetical protein